MTEKSYYCNYSHSFYIAIPLSSMEALKVLVNCSFSFSSIYEFSDFFDTKTRTNPPIPDPVILAAILCYTVKLVTIFSIVSFDTPSYRSR